MKILNKILLQVLLFLLALVTLFPLIYVLIIAFGKNVISATTFIPEGFTFEISSLFRETKFANWLANS